MSLPAPKGAPPRYLDAILARKRAEVARRRRHAFVHRSVQQGLPADATSDRASAAVAALRRPEGEPPRIIAEVKFSSPSAGVIHERRAGDGSRIACAYRDGGAAAVSVLADRPGFGGSPLEVRRVARALDGTVPVLFKEFVLDEVQVDLARAVGASMVLLLVRALREETLHALVDTLHDRGLAPVVEAANATELEIALRTKAQIVGVNARDLGTFQVDKAAAARALSAIGPDRVAVFMSGIRSPKDFAEIATTRADAVLVGEGLMRTGDPAQAVVDMRNAVS